MVVAKARQTFNKLCMCRCRYICIAQGSIQRPKLTKPACLANFTCAFLNKRGNVVETIYLVPCLYAHLYSYNYIPPLIFLYAHVRSVKHKGLVSFDRWINLSVHVTVCEWWDICISQVIFLNTYTRNYQ